MKGGVLKGESRLRVLSKKGKILIDSGKIRVKNADEAILYLTAGTNFINYKKVSGDPSTDCIHELKSLKGKSYEKIKSDHIRTYQKYFNSIYVDFRHSATGSEYTENLHNDERIKKFDSDNDPALVALYMQYARYLLISSSWPGTLPANLQGIWN